MSESKKERIEITSEHFSVFEAEVKKWINTFGLHGWSVKILHTSIENDDALAWCNAQYDQRIATICLPKIWDAHREANEPTDKFIRKQAFHEVCELLVHRLWYLGKCRYVDESEFEEARHEIIRILENVLWEKMEKNSK